MIKILVTIVALILGSVAGAEGVSLSQLKPPIPAFFDGKKHLVYEIVIVNPTTSDIHLRSLDIGDDSFGETHFEGEQLKAMLQVLRQENFDTVPDLLKLPPSPPITPGVIPANRTALVFIDIEAVPDAKLPLQIHHKVTFNIGTEASAFELECEVPISDEKPLVIYPPFASGTWFPFNGPSNISAHRRSVQRLHGHYYIGQRFAIDWAGIGDSGYLIRPNTSSQINSSYYGYGVPVYAVADAIVEKITDDLPENTPDTDSRAVTINMDTVAGNSVVLNLGENHYALYAHLQPGSLRVNKGDRVRRGDLIGLLGNSGNSTGPHLHFHICDGPSELQCQGIPYVFDTFIHQPVKAEEDESSNLRFIPQGISYRAHRELIWNNQLIEFLN